MTYFFGSHGFYFFDQGISLHYGWLLLNGYQPFLDILTPLFPLSGWLTALAFKIGSVQLLSVIYAASFLVFLVSSFCAYLLLPFFGVCSTWLILSSWLLASTVQMGDFYYNHLNLLLFGTLLTVYLTYWLGSKKKSPRGFLIFVVLLLLIFLNKYHIGLLYLVVFGVVFFIEDPRAVLSFRNWPIWLVASSVLIAFAASFSFDMTALRQSLGIPSASLQGLIEGVANCSPLGRAFRINKISDYQAYSFRVVGFVIAFAVIIEFFRSKNFTRSRIAFFLFIFGFYEAEVLLGTMTAEAPINQMAFLSLLSVFGFVFFLEDSPLQTPLKLHPVLVSFLVLHVINLASINERSLRKSWDETAALFIENRVRHGRVPDHGFFRGVWLRTDQLERLKWLEGWLLKNSNEKIFFGPELETMWAVSNRLPPKPWILWSHPTVSVNVQNYDFLAKTFEEAKFDRVVLSIPRRAIAPYLEEALKAYEVEEEKYGIQILKRRASF